MSSDARFWEVLLVGVTMVLILAAMVYSLLSLTNFFALDPVNNLL